MPDTRQPPYLEYALAEGKAEITGEGRAERIHYKAASHSERWADPEEKVRAEFWAELIYKYDYPPERIRFEVNVPRRTPNDFADIVRGVQDRGHADGQHSMLSTGGGQTNQLSFDQLIPVVVVGQRKQIFSGHGCVLNGHRLLPIPGA